MMRLRNGSASASERTLRCAGWLALPHVERESEDAARGHERHAYVRAVLEGADPKDALAVVTEPEDRRQLVLLDWDRLGGDLERPIECEGAYAIDMRARTARYLGSNIGRQYAAAAESQGQPLGRHEVPGSLDIAGPARGNPKRLVVVDMKGPFAPVPPADVNAQGLFFASAKMLMHPELEEVEFRIAHLRMTGAVWDRDRAVFTRLDVDRYLDAYEEGLRRADEARGAVAAGLVPDVAEGRWCDYCPAADACPAKTALARAMLPELAAIAARIDGMTMEEVGRAYEIANERVKPLLEQVLKPLKERVKKDGVAPFPDGERCAKVSKQPYTSFDQEKALGLLRQLGATQAQIDALFSTRTIEKVIVGNMPRAAVVKLRKKGRAA